MSTVYEIGPFRLDPEAGVLVRAGLPVQLGGRAIAVLTALVKRPNKFVPKEAILDVAWPDVVVEESNLAVQISAIRRALAAVPGGQHWIETLARRGYRFVGPVTEVSDVLRKGASGERESSNLPEPLTSFIGRERELVEIKRLLRKHSAVDSRRRGRHRQDPARAAGGGEVLAAYRDGVWLVELAPLADPALVPRAVAQVLGVREAVGHAADRDAVLPAQRARSCCWCWTTASTCSTRARSWPTRSCASAPACTILATSREAAGHHRRAGVPGAVALAARSDGTALPVSVSRVRGGAALRRARPLARAGLSGRPTRTRRAGVQSAPARRHPAGASSWRRRGCASLSVEQIDGRLDDRFRLLTGGSRTALPRQQTLRATHRLELRPADRSGEAAVAAAVGLRRRLDVGSGGAGLRRRGH